MTFKYLYYIDFKVHTYSWTMSSKELLLGIIKVLIFLMVWIKSEINFFFLAILNHCLSWINSSAITILTIKEVWSDGYQILGLML